MLIIFGGLPGTGKTTIAKKIAEHFKAVYLRIDTVEQVCLQFGELVGPEGYVICNAIAADNLRLGLNVVADSVNPITYTRDAWRKIAMEANVPAVEIELICADAEQHQQRIETRIADIPGHKLPNWQQVLQREYVPWETTLISIDTTTHSVEETIQLIIKAIESR